MQLNFKTYGQGQPLIILHGMFGSLDNWQSLAKILAEDYWVYILDQRNHGRSPHSPDFGYALMAEDLKNFMEAEGLPRASILGHSMGGKVAMRFAWEHPEMVEKLLVADMAPRAYNGNHDGIFEAMLSLPLQTIGSRQAAQDWLAARIPQASVVQFLLKNLYIDQEKGGYAWRMNLPVIRAHYEEILGHEFVGQPFEGPTLFLRGEQSDYILSGEMQDYRRFFPQAELQTIAQAGHWLHADQPQAFLQAVKTFLAQ